MKKILSSLHLFSSFAFISSILFASFTGVYFLGDTVTHLQFGLLGGPLTTFIQHDALWPPAFALSLNVLNQLPINPYVLASLFVSFAAVIYLACVAGFIRLVDFSWKTALLVSGLTLVGPMMIIIQSFISEPFFLVLWVTALIATTQFLRTSQEKWLILWLLPTALLPLTRYIGIVVVVWFSTVLFLKLINDLRLKSKKSYSGWLLTLCLGVVWMPLAFYLFRNKIQIGMPFASRDLNAQHSSLEIAVRYLSTIIKDIGVTATIALVLGASLQKIKKVKQLSLPLVVTLGSATTYLLGLFLSENRYFVLPYIPSRYLGVSYPFIIVSCFFGGYLIGQYLLKKHQFKVKPLFTSLALITAAGVLFFAAYTNLTRLNQEKQTLESTIPEVLWTGDLQKLCDTSKQQTLILHLHSRNWAAKSYAYLCSGVVVATEDTLTLEKGTNLISAYKIENQDLKQSHELFINSYTTYFYEVLKPTEINVSDIFSTRSKFE